jgi:hypothetical protein
MIELPEGNGFGTGYRLGKGPAFKRGDGILHVSRTHQEKPDHKD